MLRKAPPHLRSCIIIAYNMGMRTGEIRQIKWSFIDRKNGIIRLPKEVTKEGKPKNIPINHHVNPNVAKVENAPGPRRQG
ncbi:tyrosine-type recombinase/integrase [Thermodesulfobacteriota bacterium]